MRLEFYFTFVGNCLRSLVRKATVATWFYTV